MQRRSGVYKDAPPARKSPAQRRSWVLWVATHAATMTVRDSPHCAMACGLFAVFGVVCVGNGARCIRTGLAVKGSRQAGACGGPSLTEAFGCDGRAEGGLTIVARYGATSECWEPAT